MRDSGVPEEELLTIQEINKIVDNIKDEKSINGAKALEYIMINNEVHRKFRKMFFHWIVTYYTCSVKNVNQKDIEYEAISPMNISYNTSDNQDFIEDGESATVTFYMTLSEIMDKYHDELEEQDLKILEGRTKDKVTTKTVRFTETDIFYDRLIDKGWVETRSNMYAESFNSHTVVYVNWKSLIKVGKLTTTDISGEEITFEVDEDYKPLENETVEWSWVNQVWEGYRINDEVYFGIRPIPFQRDKLDNPSSCKLLINGRCFMNAHHKHRSIVERLKPYQKKI